MLTNTRLWIGRLPDKARAGWQILVGLEDLPGLKDDVLSLNHKRADQSLRSATEFVATASEAELDAWRDKIPFGPPEAPLDGLSIAAEDASPDTALSLLCLAERLSGRTLHTDWVDYASRWELGDGDSTGAPDASFGALASALAHAGYVAIGYRNREALGAVLRDVMAYALGLVRLNLDPANLPRFLPTGTDPQVIELHRRAHATLVRERLIYERAHERAIRTQLSVPLLDGPNQRIDVDAIFLTELDVTGVTKLLLRADPRAPLGRGYTLFGLYRPDQAGTGADMTVSVNPSAGVTLKDLWIALERREEAAWDAFATERGAAFSRPRDNPRAEMTSFAEEPPICIPSNQPWFEGKPLYTLLGAPRSVLIAGEELPGTRLTWSDVKDTIWETYAPVRDLQVVRSAHRDQQPHHLMEPTASADRGVLGDQASGLFSLSLHLKGDEGIASPVRWSQTIAASLAAFVDVGEIDMERLPQADAFDVVEERGGFAVVSARGIALLGTSAADDFPLQDLVRTAKEVAMTVSCARAVTKEIEEQIRDLVSTAIDTGSGGIKREALKKIYAAKLRARAVWSEATRFEEDVMVRRVRVLCEARWRARERLDAALAEVAELEAMVVSSSEVRANTTLNAIALIGFPFSIFSNLLGSLLLFDQSGKDVTGVSVAVLGVYLGLSGVTLLIVWLIALLADRRWRLD